MRAIMSCEAAFCPIPQTAPPPKRGRGGTFAQAPARREMKTMCGIVGFLDKRGGTDRPVGRTLLALLDALGCRGPDSTGVAVFDAHDESLRVSVPEGSDPNTV